MEKPLKLAAWLLDENIEKIKEGINTEETGTIHLEKNMTVYITYLLVMVEEDGKILWGDDPYKLNPEPQCQCP